MNLRKESKNKLRRQSNSVILKQSWTDLKTEEENDQPIDFFGEIRK